MQFQGWTGKPDHNGSHACSSTRESTRRQLGRKEEAQNQLPRGDNPREGGGGGMRADELADFLPCGCKGKQ